MSKNPNANIGEIVQPYPAIRYVMRSGEKVLQQHWLVTPTGEYGDPSYDEWRDVPVVKEVL